MPQSFSKIWIIGILAVVLTGGFFAWQYFEMQNEATGWKTYRNNEYGFEFKYPSVPAGCNKCKIQIKNAKRGFGDEQTPPFFDVNGTSVMLFGLVGIPPSEAADMITNGLVIERKKEIKIGDKNGIRVDFKHGILTIIEMNDQANILISLGNAAASGNPCCTVAGKNYEIDVYEGILSTFRFLE